MIALVILDDKDVGIAFAPFDITPKWGARPSASTLSLSHSYTSLCEALGKAYLKLKVSRLSWLDFVRLGVPAVRAETRYQSRYRLLSNM